MCLRRLSDKEEDGHSGKADPPTLLRSAPVGPTGLVENKKSWTLGELYRLPQVKQITRHICVDGWSAIGSWTRTTRAASGKTTGIIRSAGVAAFRIRRVRAEFGANTHMPISCRNRSQRFTIGQALSLSGRAACSAGTVARTLR